MIFKTLIKARNNAMGIVFKYLFGPGAIAAFVLIGAHGIHEALNYDPVRMPPIFRGWSGFVLGCGAALATAGICSCVSLFAGAIGFGAGFSERTGKIATPVLDTLNMTPKILCLVLVNFSSNENFLVIALAFAILFIPNIALPLKEKVEKLRESQFIVMAELNGCGAWEILTRHIWSNCKYTFWTLAAQGVGYALMIHFTLGFLNMGLSPFGFGNWGKMLYDTRRSFSIDILHTFEKIWNTSGGGETFVMHRIGHTVWSTLSTHDTFFLSAAGIVSVILASNWFADRFRWREKRWS